MDGADHRDLADQDPGAAAPAAGRRGPRTLLPRAVATVRTHPRQAAVAVLAFLGRWSLRIGLPIAGAATLLHTFPCRITAAGVRFRIEGTILARPGLSADTTFGSWAFPRVDGLPIGAHLSPVDVDLVRLAAGATRNPEAYADRLQHDLADRMPFIVGWLVGEVLLGVLLGLAAAAAVNLAIRYLRRLPVRPHELRLRLRQLGAAAAVLAALAALGVATYDPQWVKKSQVTGTLGALQLFPDDLQQYYTQQSKAFDVISAIAGIQAQLQQHIDQRETKATSFNIMFISDMHLASTYPLVRQYARNFGVQLIVNTGDESEFGTRFELTATYVAQIRDLTRDVPMIWLAGNHDSPETVRVMRTIPGVTVLGTKKALPKGRGFGVTAQSVDVFGLTIAGLPDPRVYGGAQASGSNDPKVVEPLERKAVDTALAGLPNDARFDIFATHEPSAADEIAKVLSGRVRQTNAGHTHAQNQDQDLRSGGRIALVEGSTGAGGLDNINRGVPAPPVEFSIESVGSDCQFTKIVRFQLAGPPPARKDVVPATGQQVTARTTYLDPQQVEDARICSTTQGRGAVADIGAGAVPVR